MLFALMLFAGASSLQAQDEFLTVDSEKTEDGGYAIYAENHHMIPLHVNITFPKLSNLRPTAKLPFTKTLEPGQGKQLLFRLKVENPRASRAYSIQYSYSRGDPNTAEHNDNALYLFPYEHGTKHRVTQGFHGRYTHSGQNEYAVDFEMDVGTPVHAARSGLVVEVTENRSTSSTSTRYEQLANRVLVYHKDGSFANYAHLKRNGAAVEAGQRVKAGELIGYSGNTGQSSGPHLHFDVRMPQKNGAMQSIPFRFRGEDGKGVKPTLNGVYYSYHPGKPSFETVYGRDISASDYEGYSKRIKGTGKLDIRTEQEDLTYVVFLRNGFDRSIDATVRFQLRGMKAGTKLPRKLQVPPRTEVFLTVLRADAQASSWRFSPQIRYRFAE